MICLFVANKQGIVLFGKERMNESMQLVIDYPMQLVIHDRLQLVFYSPTQPMNHYPIQPMNYYPPQSSTASPTTKTENAEEAARAEARQEEGFAQRTCPDPMGK